MKYKYPSVFTTLHHSRLTLLACEHVDEETTSRGVDSDRNKIDAVLDKYAVQIVIEIQSAGHRWQNFENPFWWITAIMATAQLHKILYSIDF